MLWERLIGALLLAVFFVPLGWIGGVPFALLAGFLAGRGVWEWLTVLRVPPSLSRVTTGIAFLTPLLVHWGATQNEWVIVWCLGTGIIGLLSLLCLLGRWRGEGEILSRTAFLLWAWGYVGGTCSALVLIRHWGVNAFWLHPTLKAFGAKVFWTLVAATWGTDITAYFAGHFIKSAPLAPSLSPRKTLVGSGFGFVFGLIISSLLGTAFGLPLLDLLVIGVSAGIFGQVGDLLFSAIKREAKVKDFPPLLPGHGGVLDRFDSLFLASLMTLVWLSLVHP